MTYIGIISWFMGSLAGRVLLSLGMGLISYASVLTVGQSLISDFSASWGAIPTATLSLLAMAGFPDSLGIIMGAYLAKLTLNILPKIGVLPSGT